LALIQAEDAFAATIKVLNSFIEVLKADGTNTEAEKLSREAKELLTTSIENPTTNPQSKRRA
jgi:hypothetical protein